MFPVRAQFDGKRLDKEYVTERAKWEPLYEVTQIKGDGEVTWIVVLLRSNNRPLPD